MKVLKHHSSVPYKLDFNNVPKLVDIIHFICFVVISSQVVFSQELSRIDSLKIQYAAEKNISQKMAIGNKIFYGIVRKNPEDGKAFIDGMFNISTKQDYELGKAISYAGLGYYYRFLPNIDSSRYFYRKAIATFDKLPPTKYHNSTYEDFAILEGTRGDYDQAIQLLDKNIILGKKIKSGRSIAHSLKRKGSLLSDKGNFKEAITTMLEAIRIIDTLQKPYPKLKAILLGQMSTIEMSLGKPKEATSLITESIKIFESIDDPEFIAVAYNELGNINYGQGKYDDALDAFNKSKVAAERIGYQFIIGVVNNNLGKTYSKKQNFKKALALIDEGLAITKKYAPLNNVADGIATKGNIYYDNKKYSEAINQYTQAIALADSINANELEASFYKSRSNANEKAGNLKAALADFKTHKKLNDSVFNKESSNEIERLKIIYDTEKKEKEIALQARDIAEFEKEQSKAKTRQWLLGISILSLLIITSFLLYAIKQKAKRTHLEKEKLQNTIQFKEKELTTHALHLAHKNEVLLQLKKQVKELKNTDNHTRKYQNIINNINLDINSDASWEQFKSYFEDVHKDFNNTILNRYPEVSNNDLRLMGLLKMNLSSKEIANILNISLEGVKKARYRLRKKLALATEESLEELIIKM